MHVTGFPAIGDDAILGVLVDTRSTIPAILA